MNKKMLIAGVILILLGIVLGAFGAHGLKIVISDEILLNAFETGVRYQIYHGLAFLILGFSKMGIRFKGFPFLSMLFGVVLFSGSIYLLVINPITGNNIPKFVGAITPIGGTLLIISWIIILVRIIREKQIFVEK